MKYHNLNYNIIPLSPIHIGSGEVMDPFRFLVKDGYAHLVNTNAYMSHLAQKDGRNFKQLIKNSIFRPLLEYIWDEFDTQNPALYHFRYPVSKEITKIFEQNIKDERNQNLIQEYIRSGLFQPYIPGSSIKGSFRTAIISALYDLDGKNLKRKKFEAELLQAINPSNQREAMDKDPFKMLKFSDAMIKNEDLEINKVERVYVTKRKEAITFYAETIKARYQVLSQTTMSIASEFLNDGAISKITGAEPNISKKLHALTKEINSYYIKKLKEDAAQIKILDYKNIYNGILEKYEELPDGNFILRIGKGSGQNFLSVNNPALKIPITKSTVSKQSMGWCMFYFTTNRS